MGWLLAPLIGMGGKAVAGRAGCFSDVLGTEGTGKEKVKHVILFFSSKNHRTLVRSFQNI